MAIPASELPKSESEWQVKLTPEQFKVLRLKGTERAGTVRYFLLQVHALESVLFINK
jgi:peptide-methionine (R)-S-oxide reductase